MHAGNIADPVTLMPEVGGGEGPLRDSSSWSSSATAAWSRKRPSTRSGRGTASTGSARSSPGGSARWSRAASSSSTCSTSATCSDSPIPIIRASGWWPAAIPSWQAARPRARGPAAGDRGVSGGNPSPGRGRLKGADRISLAVGKVVNRYKVAKHFDLDIGEAAFSFARNAEKIAGEAALNGLYVIRTSLAADRMAPAERVRSYKALIGLERAFRTMKSVDLKIRPIHHLLEDRVRAHILLCMLAYYVEWHMREAWRELMFADEDQEAKASRDPVAPASDRPRRSRKPARANSTTYQRHGDLHGPHHPQRPPAPRPRTHRHHQPVDRKPTSQISPSPSEKREISTFDKRIFRLKTLD